MTTKKRLKILGMLLAALYLAVLPVFIANYGIANGIEGFDSGAPRHEIQSIFAVVWMFGNGVVFFLPWLFYMMTYGWQQKEDE